jgi:hypothetical protein
VPVAIDLALQLLYGNQNKMIAASGTPYGEVAIARAPNSDNDKSLFVRILIACVWT